MKVAIVIPTINLWKKYTKPCIDSIKTKHDYRILLLDNKSDDETLTEAGKIVSDKFCHHRLEERWCCSKNWNYGVRDAFERGFDYVFLLNNDTLLHPEAIDRLVERFEASKRKEVVVHEQLKAFVKDNSDATGESLVSKKKPEYEELAMVTLMDVTGECKTPEAIFTFDADSKSDVPESEHPCFSGFMITKECFERVGPFDENFKPCYFEDNDYHYRVNLAGMKAIVLPTAVFYHYGSRTQIEALGGVPICPPPLFENNRAYFHAKWGGAPGHEQFITPFNK